MKTLLSSETASEGLTHKHMATRTKFPADRGLTARMMTTSSFSGCSTRCSSPCSCSSTSSSDFILVIGLGILFVQYFFSDKIALYSMGGQDRHPRASSHSCTPSSTGCARWRTCRSRSSRIAQTDIPNAFATGRDQKHAVVCVTTGLLRRLNEPEVEAVLAHELSHVAHRDVAVMTIASFLGILAGLMTRMFMYWGCSAAWAAAVVTAATKAAGPDRADRDGDDPRLGVVYAISFVLIRTLSRYRELAADRSGAILIGQPALLASALVKVSGEMSRIPTRDLRARPSTSTPSSSPRRSRPGVEPLVPLRDAPAAAEAPRPARQARRRDAPRRRLTLDTRHVGFLDALLGRTKPAQPNLDKLFGLPGARITLEAVRGARPDRQGRGLLQAGGRPGVRRGRAGDHRRCSNARTTTPDAQDAAEQSDEFGYRWIVARRRRLRHARHPGARRRTRRSRTTATARSCSARCSASRRRPPTDGAATDRRRSTSSTSTSAAPSTRSSRLAREHRDNEAELRLKNELGEDLAIEPDLDRWFPLWGLPVH